ncbi:cyclic AMP-dependent transcription factor ATF-6 beta-like isoform X2 [Petromyzon marinus]|uniref:cyclic AMP-dependent transcription factor ATF-6 beta-like isoform X2 n=1 Tax=Petromyzon marinus TaxID=7757 RepID=UPI003F71D406
MESFLVPNHVGVDDYHTQEMGHFDLEEEMDLNELNDIFRALKRDMELEEDVELDMEALAAAAADVAEPWSDIYKQIFTDAEVKEVKEVKEEEKEDPGPSSPDSGCLGSPASIGTLGPEDVKRESFPPTPPTLPGDVPCPSPLPTTVAANSAIAALRTEEPRGPATRTGGPLLLPRCPAGPAGPVPPLPVLLTPVALLAPATAGPRRTATHGTGTTAMVGPAARTVVLRCPSQLLPAAGSGVGSVPLPITARNVVVPASASGAKPIVPAPAAPIPSAPAGADERVWRRQQRMMKNRESACQSRARKRQQLQQLQGQLQAALGENAALRRENAALRSQLAQLLALAQGGGGVAPRTTKAVCAMVLLAFFVLGYGPLGLGPLGEAPHSPAPHPRLLPPLAGRRLLGYEEQARPPASTPTETQRPHSRARWADSELVLRRDDPVVILPQSCIQLNSSEILRLSGELHGWILRHEQQRNRTVLSPAARSTPPRKSQRRSPPLIPPTAPTDNSAERALSSQLQVPGEWRWRQSWDFLELIGRRDDTFYVVSFRRDHLLLPARAHNHTRRPRMSLLMPAMAQHNDSVVQEDAGESMMQIDCEVTNTRLLHAKTRTAPSSPPSSPPSAPSSPSPSLPPRSSSLHTARGR